MASDEESLTRRPAPSQSRIISLTHRPSTRRAERKVDSLHLLFPTCTGTLIRTRRGKAHHADTPTHARIPQARELHQTGPSKKIGGYLYQLFGLEPLHSLLPGIRCDVTNPQPCSLHHTRPAIILASATQALFPLGRVNGGP